MSYKKVKDFLLKLFNFMVSEKRSRPDREGQESQIMADVRRLSEQTNKNTTQVLREILDFLDQQPAVAHNDNLGYLSIGSHKDNFILLMEGGKYHLVPSGVCAKHRASDGWKLIDSVNGKKNSNDKNSKSKKH